jgi:glycosyltransferase involved in cell wall biosynthesis
MTSARSNVYLAKVCIVSPLPPPYGGMSLQAKKLAARLNDEGITVELLPTNPQFPQAIQFTEKIPGLRTVIRVVIFVRSLFRNLPDVHVVHHLTKCGLFFFLLTVPVMVVGCKKRKRVVLNYRGGRAPAFLRRWGWFAIPVMRKADSVVVPSDFLRRVFASHGLAVSVVPNLVETEHFSFRERKVLRPMLLVTRHLEPLYNVECLLRAFRILKKRFPEAQLSIAGTGSEEQRLRNLCKAWNLAGVKFCGYVSPLDLSALYDAHDIFVNSSNADNFPGALVEAACSGLPIVTTRAGGIPDMIEHRESGLLVSINDHDALAASVIELLENPELARRLARKARLWAEQFSWPATFASLLEHYGLSPAEKSGRWSSSSSAVPSTAESAEARMGKAT